MKIQCDVCEKAPATLICCADEAALCARCDVEVHAANKLASKHQRLMLMQTLSNKLPPCDICQEKAAFIFCVEDRALFCRDCDEPVHSAGSLAANHQRFLASGIRVALSSSATKETGKSHQEPPPPVNTAVVPHVVPVMKAPSHQVSGYTSPSWAVDDLLQFSDFDSSGKKEQLEFGEIEWLTDYGVFCDEAAEVPQLPTSQPINNASYRQTKLHAPHNKKPKYEIPYIEEDDDEHLQLHLQPPNFPATTTTMASAFLSAPTFQGLRPLNKPTDSTSLFLTTTKPSSISTITPKKKFNCGVKAELNTSLVISLSTGLSLFLGRFVFFNFQRENVAKQGLPEQNGITHFEAGDTRAKEYVSLLKSNDPVGFNIVDVLAWGSIGHIVAYYILATSSNGYDPNFF